MELTRVLKEVKPSNDEKKKFEEEIHKVLKKLNLHLKKVDAEAILGGSAAKGTWLKDQHDVDIYVRFNYIKYRKKSDELSNILEKHLAFAFPGFARVVGSRDYFQFKKGNLVFEIIPILDIKEAEEALNITDISLLHVNWVKSKLTEKLDNEVRLAKFYCKALGVYGAESYIRGFSGYVLEILIAYYRSFSNLVKAAANWKLKEVIDIENYYRKNEALQKLDDEYCPLIVVDPVQASRNAAAALSVERFSEFVLACKNYSEKQFKKKILKLGDLKKEAKKNGTKLLILNLKSGVGKEDIVGAKLLKLLLYIRNEIELADFHVFKYGWDWDKKEKAIFWFMVHTEVLPKYKKHFGPPVWEHGHCEKFREKWKNIELLVENNKVYIEVPRKFQTVELFLKDLIKKLPKMKYVKVV